jgi:hypothetical protein
MPKLALTDRTKKQGRGRKGQGEMGRSDTSFRLQNGKHAGLFDIRIVSGA